MSEQIFQSLPATPFGGMGLSPIDAAEFARLREDERRRTEARIAFRRRVQKVTSRLRAIASNQR